MLPCRTYRNDIEFSVLVRSPSQVNSLSFHLVQKTQSRQVDVPVPAMSAVLHMFSIIDSVNYLNEGINAEKMGIAGMNRDEIRNILENGF